MYKEIFLQFPHSLSALLPGHVLFLELKCEIFPSEYIHVNLIVLRLEILEVNLMSVLELFLTVLYIGKLRSVLLLVELDWLLCPYVVKDHV